MLQACCGRLTQPRHLTSIVSTYTRGPEGLVCYIIVHTGISFDATELTGPYTAYLPLQKRRVLRAHVCRAGAFSKAEHKATCSRAEYETICVRVKPRIKPRVQLYTQAVRTTLHPSPSLLLVAHTKVVVRSHDHSGVVWLWELSVHLCHT
jgi:hypothetical protein